MHSIDELRRSHRDLSNLIAALLVPDAITPPIAELIRQQVTSLADKLQAHLAQQNVALIALCAAPPGSILRTAGETHQHEARTLADHFLGFSKRWSPVGALEQDFASFRIAVVGLRGALDRLIWREENDVYPLASPDWEPRPVLAPPPTGIRELDEDHDEMFAVIGYLRTVINQGSNEIDNNQVATLAAYAERHFDREEALMAATGYEGLEDHRQEHHRARAILLGFRNDYLDGRKIGAAAVLIFLENWMASHIAGTDLRMTEYLRSFGAVR